MVKNVLAYLNQTRGVEIISATVPPLSPATTVEDLLAPVKQALAADSIHRIKAMVISHISSEPAVVMPVEQVARLCAARGIPLFVDGAHATGQIEVDIGRLAAAGVKGYVGDGHKWLYSGKGSAVLWIAPEYQARVVPAVISSEGVSKSPGECSILPFSAGMDQYSCVLRSLSPCVCFVCAWCQNARAS